MSYSAIETSVHSGAPAELYLFSYDGQLYGYTSATRALTVTAQDYTPVPIERGKLVWGIHKTNAALVLTTPSDFVPALLFEGFPPETQVGLIIYRYHITDVAEETVTLWNGRVRGATWQEGKAILTCDNFLSTLNKTGPRLQYQYMCNHVLYGTACGISKASFSVSVQLYSAVGIDLYSTALAGYADGWFTGGFITYGNKHRMITSHVGDHITIAVSFRSLPDTAVVTVYAGCGHTHAVCGSKFSNTARYGGFPFVPNRNLFVVGVT